MAKYQEIHRYLCSKCGFSEDVFVYDTTSVRLGEQLGAPQPKVHFEIIMCGAKQHQFCPDCVAEVFSEEEAKIPEQDDGGIEPTKERAYRQAQDDSKDVEIAPSVFRKGRLGRTV